MKRTKITTENKYKNKKILVDGVLFDSQKEASRYKELLLLERSGNICNLDLQVKFEVIPKTKGERATHYIADFTYYEKGKFIIEDVKSVITRKKPDYIMKRKLMKYLYCQNEDTIFREYI